MTAPNTPDDRPVSDRYLAFRDATELFARMSDAVDLGADVDPALEIRYIADWLLGEGQ